MARLCAQGALTGNLHLLRVVLTPGGINARRHSSAPQATFIWWRDLTCRFPGCDAPAQVCDIDHTTPYPYGPTHPSNTKLYCRSHRVHKRLTAGEMKFRRNPPLRRRDGEEMPLARHTLELVSAAVLKIQS